MQSKSVHNGDAKKASIEARFSAEYLQPRHVAANAIGKLEH
jgi:hypothetical protein